MSCYSARPRKLSIVYRELCRACPLRLNTIRKHRVHHKTTYARAAVVVRFITDVYFVCGCVQNSTKAEPEVSSASIEVELSERPKKKSVAKKKGRRSKASTGEDGDEKVCTCICSWTGLLTNCSYVQSHEGVQGPPEEDQAQAEIDSSADMEAAPTITSDIDDGAQASSSSGKKHRKTKSSTRRSAAGTSAGAAEAAPSNE